MCLLQLFAWAGPQLNSSDVEEIKKFASLNTGKGNLLTPPRGSVKPEIIAVRNYVETIFNELVGSDLKAREVHYIVNVYGNNSMNAWVQQMDPNAEGSSEEKWIKAHPDQIWPLRKAWNLPDDKKPIYEIGVTTELLKALDSRDELAFILGHEATHLLEGHTDHSKSSSGAFKKWWSSQSHEVVADHLSIDKILGKYELDAALTSMEKLHPKTNSAMSVDDALKAGAGTHHAEGVRISALQYYIEYLRRFNPKASPRTPSEIPASVKLNVYGRQAKVDPKGDPHARENYFKVIDQFLDNSYPTSDIYSESRNELFDGLFGKPATHSYSQLLYETFIKIDKSAADKVTKLNSFLKALIFLGVNNNYYLYDDLAPWLKTLGTHEIFQITQFILKNSIGENAWTLNDYQKLMKTLPFSARTYIESPLMGNPIGQKIFSQLVKVSPQWRDLLDYWTSLESFDRDGSYEMEKFGKILRLLGEGHFPASPLRDLYRKKLIDDFSQVKDVNKLFSKVDESGLTEYGQIRVTSFPNQSSDTQNWNQLIQNAKAKYEPAFQKLYFDQLVRLFAKENKTSKEKSDISFGLTRLDQKALSEADRMTLQDFYERHIWSTLNPLRQRKGIPNADFLHNADLDLVAQLMKKNLQDRPKLLQYVRYLLVANMPSHLKNKNLSKSAEDIFKQVTRSLTKNEIFVLSETFSSLEREIWAEVKEMSTRFKARNLDDLEEKIFELKDENEKARLFEKYSSWKDIDTNPRVQINLLQLIGEYGGDDLANFGKFNFADLNRVLRNMELSAQIRRFDGMFRVELGIPLASAKILFETFYRNIESIPNFEQQISTYERIVKIAGPAFMPTADQETRIHEVLGQSLRAMKLTSQFQWLKNEMVRKAMGSAYVGETLANYVHEITKSDRKRLSQEVGRVLSVIPLREKWPDAFVVFRNKLSEKAQVQPFEIKTVFLEDPRTVTEKVDLEGNLIRGMSSFSTFTRAMPPQEQIEMIEFIMGRSTTMPKTLAEYSSGAQDIVDARQLFFKLREEMKFRTPIERAMVVNSVLAGPNGLPANPAGLDLIQHHLLKSISANNKEMALTLLKALSSAEGRNNTLILSYALSQDTQSEKSLSEGAVLKSLLDFYGVPGVKLAQYLAFTSEFKDFQAALETYQDAAMPISYYDALLLLIKRLGDKWDPSLYKVIKIIGSGSVNIAIEYQNLKSGKNEVVSIARDEIEVKTKEDFRRFRLLMVELTRTEAQKKKFDFVVGLMDLIEKSVNIEFDKKNSFEIQKQVQNLYRRTVDGWNIRTVDAYSIEGMAIMMEKAPGVGARKILKTDPAMYESAMRAFMQVEYGILRGVNQTQNWNPVPLHANPDIHDGQIMIEAATKTVTVLDFGQALNISNQEREFAIDILRIISRAESTKSAYNLIQKYSLLLQNKKVYLDKSKLESALNKGERMDVFVHTLSVLSRSGLEVPLATVHWVLAANRLIKLGEKVRLSPESSIKWMLGMRKIGLPLSAFNAAKAVSDNVKDSFSRPNRGSQIAPAPMRCSSIFSAHSK